VLGVVLTVAFLFQGLYIFSIGFLVFTMYTPEQCKKFNTFILIACLFLLTVFTTLFIDIGLGGISIRNLVIATVARILANQIETLESFLSSYYCRGVSRKTASSLIKRSYTLTITCLACFIIVGFIVRPGGTLLQIPERDINLEEIFGETTSIEMDEIFELIDDFEDDVEDLPMQHTVGGGENQTNKVHLDINLIDIVIIVAAVGVIGLIIWISIKQYNPESRFEDYDEIIEESPADFKKLSKKRKRTFNLGVNYTIRRLFKRKVREHIIAKNIFTQKSDTPKKLTEAINEWENIEPLKNLYQKARYSGEDVKRIELNSYYNERKKMHNN